MNSTIVRFILATFFIFATCFFSNNVDAADGDGELRKFLISTPGTYGWQPTKGDISYDFFEDGRVHIQGPDGEATMWEGKWTLKGDQLTIVNPEKKTKETFTAEIKGDNLLLNGLKYRRVMGE